LDDNCVGKFTKFCCFILFFNIMKELFQDYVAYNLWANKLLMEKCAGLPTDVLIKEMGSSFGSIYKTFEHLMEVESIWLQRVKLEAQITPPEKDANQDFEVLSKKLQATSTAWIIWVNEASEKNIGHVFGYYNSQKKFFKQPVYEMLLHLFNHQSYHRGQIVTMLRQNNIDKIPATDYINFARNKSVAAQSGR
jgi:uncharacterized damage-inducible protein DinB